MILWSASGDPSISKRRLFLDNRSRDSSISKLRFLDDSLISKLRFLDKEKEIPCRSPRFLHDSLSSKLRFLDEEEEIP